MVRLAPTPSASPTAAPATAGRLAATVIDNRFQPNSLSVAVGTTVTWTNQGSNTHGLNGMAAQVTVQSGRQVMSITFTARTFGMLGAALLSVLAVLAPHHLAATAARAQTPTANVRDSQAVDEIDLTAGPVKWEIQPRLVVDGWGYNGQVPG